MILKIIHYIWFGGWHKPEAVVNQINQSHEILPNYQIMEWNEQTA